MTSNLGPYTSDPEVIEKRIREKAEAERTKIVFWRCYTGAMICIPMAILAVLLLWPE